MSPIIALTSAALAQSSPTDLTDASLADLLQLDVDAWSGEADLPRIRLNYGYVRSTFDGYRAGTQPIPLDQALFDPGTGTARTDENFPVLPTRIIQEAHQLEAGVRITEALTGWIAAPFIRQSTDHISIVEGYDAFTIDSSGIGDVVVSASVRLLSAGPHRVSTSAGLSIPTGSIDQVGDTPRAPGDQQLPYTMQTGSGTWDVPLGVTWQGAAADQPWTWQVEGAAKLRTGRNARDYRLGHRARGAVTIGARAQDWFEPRATLGVVGWGPIAGRDEALIVPGDFEYPAPVTDPALFGGVKALVAPGFALGLPGAEGRWAQQRMSIQASVPVFQSLSGPQPEEDWTLSSGLSLAW